MVDGFGGVLRGVHVLEENASDQHVFGIAQEREARRGTHH